MGTELHTYWPAVASPMGTAANPNTSSDSKPGRESQTRSQSATPTESVEESLRLLLRRKRVGLQENYDYYYYYYDDDYYFFFFYFYYYFFFCYYYYCYYYYYHYYSYYNHYYYDYYDYYYYY